MLLLHHAAAASDYNARIFKLVGFEHAHIAENPVLSMLAHGAGVENNKLSLCAFLRKAIAHFGKHAFYMFAVCHILLAAVSYYAGKRRGTVSF